LAVAKKILRLAALAQDFGSRLRRRESASSSIFTCFRQSYFAFLLFCAVVFPKARA
jgi:hypothetical protein